VNTTSPAAHEKIVVLFFMPGAWRSPDE